MKPDPIANKTQAVVYCFPDP